MCAVIQFSAKFCAHINNFLLPGLELGKNYNFEKNAQMALNIKKFKSKYRISLGHMRNRGPIESMFWV